MPRIYSTQSSYNAGELGELMLGRADDPKYAAGLAKCVNAVVTPQGPIKNRAGFMFVAETKYSNKPCILIPFTYSADQTMVIELGDKYARFHTQGKTLMNAEGTAPYEIETPWAAEHLYEIHYTQNADIMTLVHPYYPPQELRRYSAQDWRMVPVKLTANLTPPTGVIAERTSAAANDDNASKYTQYYVVTAMNKDRTEESAASDPVSVVANLFATGTVVTITWEAVEGAYFYRVYKLQGGIYGFIGETTATSIMDDNIAPETGDTPPYTDDVFLVAKGIKSVTVTNGGSGYPYRGIKAITLHATKPGNNGPYGTPSNDPAWVGTESHPWSWDDFNGVWADDFRFTIDSLPTLTLESKTGSGAVLEPVLSFTYAREEHWNGGDSTDVSARYYLTAKLTGIKVSAVGEGYIMSDKLILDWSACRITGTLYCDTDQHDVPQLSFPFTFNPSGEEADPVDISLTDAVELNVTDSTGYGAKLQPLVKDGVITEVLVLTPGMNYTDPTITAVSTAGSGATFEAVIEDTGDYPAAVGYFEQRRIFAGSPMRPQQIWMTVTGTDSNMTYHLPLQDTDRISFAVASRDLNQIQHIVALQQLVALTSAAEWRVSPLNSDAITPTSISVRPQSYIGASTVQPQIINTNVLYVAARGGHIRELAYSYNAGGYVTGDVSIRAAHLFDGYEFLQLAYTKQPEPYLWAVRGDGVLLGFNYVPEQQVGAWFQVQTAGKFLSAAVVQEGVYDNLYVVTERTVGSTTKRFIERQAVRDDASPGSGLFLDCAGELATVSSTRERADGTEEEVFTVSGLTWLKGATVTAVADGVVYAGLVVSDEGTIELPRAANRVFVGLPYTATVQTLPVAVGVSDNSLSRGHPKNVNRVALRIYRTTGIQLGPDEAHLKPMKMRTAEPYGSPPSLQSGEIDLASVGTWQRDGTFVVSQPEPYPFTLVCHSAEIEYGG